MTAKKQLIHGVHMWCAGNKDTFQNTWGFAARWSYMKPFVWKIRSTDVNFLNSSKSNSDFRYSHRARNNPHLMCDSDCQHHSQCNLWGTPNYNNGAGADYAPVTISDSSILQHIYIRHEISHCSTTRTKSGLMNFLNSAFHRNAIVNPTVVEQQLL